MNGFYQFTTKIKDTLKLDPFVKTVTYGDIFQVDLNKKTIFPLSHLVVNNVTKESNVMRFNVSILAMDIVDMSREATTDIFIGNDNTHDIWHTQLKVLDRLTELMRRGSIVTEGYQLDGNPTFEQFTERFENYLAGWTVTFDVIVGNDMTICEVGSSGGSCAAAGYVIKDSAGTTLYNGTIASGESSIITVGNSTVENSDASYSDVVVAEGSLTLPDVTINAVNSASTELASDIVASVTDATLNIPDITFTDSDGTSSQVPAGVNITASACAGATYNSAELTRTGQTTSYATGDDGDLEKGRGGSFFLLPYNSPFGNTNRFTSDNFSAQTTYTNNIVIDWSTYNGSTVLGYKRTIMATANWATQISNCNALSFGGYTSGWRLCNVQEYQNIANYSLSQTFNYAPFNLSTSSYQHTSTTDPGNTNSALKFYNPGGWCLGDNKLNTATAIACRTFTVTGTTLS